MKNLKAILIFFILFTYSCSNDYLDEEIYGASKDTEILKDKADFQQAITAALSKIDSKWGYYSVTFMNMEDGATDYFQGGGDFVNFSQWRTSYPGGLDWAVWNPLWDSIYYSNLVLDRLDNFPVRINADGTKNPEDLADKNRIEGQARFFRAFNYYFAQSNYGGVPIVSSASDKGKAIPQSTREEVRQFIENDLIIAANLLPNKADVQAEGQLSRPSKQAALGLLARLYINWESRADRWDKTSETCDKIINDPLSGLDLDIGAPYSKIFALNNENNKEIVYAIEHNTTNFDSGVSLLNLIFAIGKDSNDKNDMMFPNASTVGSGNYTVAANFYYEGFEGEPYFDDLLQLSDYKTNDLRHKQLILSYTNLSGGISIVPYGVLVAKYPLDFINKDKQISGNDQPIIRYADIILMKAEALNHLVGPDEAVPFVNRIRNRAGLGNLESPHKDSFDNLNEYIYHERRREFFCEGLGRTDMIRFVDTSPILSLPDINLYRGKNKFLLWVGKKLGLPEGTEADKKYLVYPFELNAMTQNTALKQNPGYTN